MQTTTDTPFEYQTIEIIYTSDCGGNGGYVISTINGDSVYDIHASKETEYFSEHFSDLSREGWEVLQCSGGSWMYLEYEYRKAFLRRSPTTRQQQWEYMDIQIEKQADELFTYSINDGKVDEPQPWSKTFQKLQATGWMLAFEPYKLVNDVRLFEIILKRAVSSSK